MRILPRFILVKIDKAKQRLLQEKRGSIFLSPKFLYMKYNLQYAEVVQVGEKAAKAFPGLQVGDTALFRHTIESDDWREVQREFNPAHPKDYSMRDEFRVIDATVSNGRELLGYIKPDGTWYANDHYIFVNPDVKWIAKEYFTSLIVGNDPIWKDDQTIMEKLDAMKLDQENIKETLPSIREAYKLEDTYKYLERIAQDMERLTKLLHAKKICKGTVEIVGSIASRVLNIKVGSTIFIDDYALMYPLKIMDKDYLLIENEFVFGVMV